ncbi:MAG: heavy-metal-associated domain-containing protein [Acidobacteria bacterium]|nr:heavy-metal-associated domain-containing protein [Acidobacteriota bacterium]
MSDQVELQIEGMHCDHCESTVGEALNRADMAEVSVDIAPTTATPDHRPSTNFEPL